jgi:acyl-CoA synthetase (AMP-forming)/AMP-acid ligase II
MNNTILTLLSQSRLKAAYAAGFWQDATLYSLVEGFAKSHPDHVAVRSRAGTLSYRALLAQVDALALDLSLAGVRAGERVAVWLSSRIETVIAFAACSRNGYVCCPSLHRDHTVAEIAELCQRMRASAFIGENGYGADGKRADIFKILRESAELKRIHALDPVGAKIGYDLAHPAEVSHAPVKNEPDLVLYLAFTSGTTGRPKGVMHSDNTLLANARALIKDWHFDAQSVIYTMSPLSHNLGLGSMVMALASGAEIVLHDLAKGESLLDRLNGVEATFLVGVPTHAINLVAELKSRGIAPPRSLKGFRISGAPAPRELVEQLLQLGITPQSGYGMTEAGSHHYTHPSDGPDRIVGSSGRACDGYEVRIFSKDDPDQELPVGEIGQIGGRGASLMLGYFDDQKANDEAFNRDGWFMTGDIGKLDQHNYLQITGRKKDLIIRGGHNIYPAKIENLAMQHEAIARAAALPVPDDRLGEKVCLVVMCQPGHTIEPNQLLDHLDKAGLSKFDMPEYFLKLDEIPLTASGKILKRKIATQLLDGTLSPKPIKWKPPGA